MTCRAVQKERGFHGILESTRAIQGLGIVQLVVFHLRVQLNELLITICGVGEILHMIVAVTQERQSGSGLQTKSSRTVIACKRQSQSVEISHGTVRV